jgi:hypothetical protein
VPVNTDGTCSTTVVSRAVGYTVVGANVSAARDYTTPVLVAPVNGAKYCLDLYASAVNVNATPAAQPLYFQVAAYTSAGKYTGGGAAAPDGPPAAPQQKSAVVRRR